MHHSGRPGCRPLGPGRILPHPRAGALRDARSRPRRAREECDPISRHRRPPPCVHPGMWMLFKEGGWWMWFILVFGAITLGTSFAFLMRPSSKHLGFIKWMSRAVLYSTAAGILMDFS